MPNEIDIKESKFLKKLDEGRIVLIDSEITDALATRVMFQLLNYEKENPDKDIYMYINSPGGSVSAGLAIYDTMKYVKCDVVTICYGMAASMGSFLLSSGTKGKRFALPHSVILIHQVLTPIKDVLQNTELRILTRQSEKTQEELERILSINTGKTVEKIHEDCDRDNYMTAVEAIEYGLIDSILERK